MRRKAQFIEESLYRGTKWNSAYTQINQPSELYTFLLMTINRNVTNKWPSNSKVLTVINMSHQAS